MGNKMAICSNDGSPNLECCEENNIRANNAPKPLKNDPISIWVGSYPFDSIPLHEVYDKLKNIYKTKFMPGEL